jgi:O-antigen ligase/Flp pilus assembly protein TadD
MQKSEGTAKQIARWVALGALFLIPLAPLIVVNSYFFPFITGKAFFFRILIEIAVCAWAVLALLDKKYRPRFSWVGVAVLAFVVWMFVADCFAVNVAKAFLSNFERMEGWVLLIHLLGFFVVASAILRVEKKWRAWFLASLGVSLVISAYAILQLGGALAIHQGSSRIDATFGNSAYLAIYFLFNVFIALWLAFSEKRPWLKWSLIALAALEAMLIFFTETRGTILGLVGALALSAFLFALTAGKKIRQSAVGALAIILILIGGFYAARNSSFVQNNHVLERIASISLADGQTRFTIWHMAFEGVIERPVVGWGQEGFNYVFNKYYDPSLYQQESWFDRAHNAFIDWLTAGGVPAFLLYISLFVSAIVLLWRSSELSRPERILLTAALVGYAVHNFFVFDNLYSYVYFFAILAFIDSQISRPIRFFEHTPELSPADGTLYALPIALIAAGALIWTINIPGMRASSELITALSSSADPGTDIAIFQDLIAHPAFAAQEIREQLVDFAVTVAQSSATTDAEKQQAVSLAITEMQKQVASYPLDAREHLELSYAYRAAGDNADALKEIQTALTLSPKKEEIWIEAGAVEMNGNNVKAAQTDFNTAYALGPQFPDLAVYAAAGDIVAGDQSTADKILLGAYGTTTVDSDVLVVAYYQAKNWPRLIALWNMRVGEPSANAETWFGLASAYYVAGDNADAINTINKAVALFPDAASSGAAAILQIEGKSASQ